jgi:hypothetical protein
MPRSKSNEFNNEMDKTSELLGEALLNAIRLAVREEIREALIQGRFSFNDRLLAEEAFKVLQVSPDWLCRSHGGWGRKRYAFHIESFRHGFGGMSA